MTDAVPRDPVVQAATGWLRQRLDAGAALAADSRALRPGDGFFGWPGGAVDGRRFWPAALDAGAAASLVEADDWPADVPRPGPADPVLAVPALRRRAGPIASAWHGEPSHRLTVVAVTGTNGKTSCTHWIADGANRRAGRDCAAVIGTLGAGLPGRLDPSTRLTTPDPLQLQQVLAGCVAAGIDLVAIEASSIGLVQHRLEGTAIAIAVMTNLTRDHLDAHGSMDAYAAAKARLFDWPGLGAAVVNLDDPVAAAMLDRLAPATRRIGYTLAPFDDPAGPGAPCSPDASARRRLDTVIRAEPMPPAAGPTAFRLVIDEARAPVRLALLGTFNRANALAVAGVWHALGWPIEAIADGLGALRPVPGRLEFVGAADDLERPLVVVDYAHTPDALGNVLAALRPLATGRGGRLWCVFGAGGDRDRGKRPEMSRIAAAGADAVVLTSDNPRSEDPLAILADLDSGLDAPPALAEVDRRRAIDRVVADAAAADVILVAGKGHEDYQEVAGVRLPFSDVAIAREAHRRRAAARPSSSAASGAR